MAIQFSVMTWNVENLFPPGTFISPSSELIDHIMVSKGLLLRGADFIVKEVRSFLNLIAGQSVTNDPNERATIVVPDHAPVLARFEL